MRYVEKSFALYQADSPGVGGKFDRHLGVGVERDARSVIQRDRALLADACHVVGIEPTRVCEPCTGGDGDNDGRGDGPTKVALRLTPTGDPRQTRGRGMRSR